MALYIHQLKDLTPKSADIESTFIIRDLRKQFILPISGNKVFDQFSLFFVSDSEIDAILSALEAIEPAAQGVREIAALKDEYFEPINLKRAVEMIAEIPKPLMLNLDYARGIKQWQEEFTENFATLMNRIPQLSTQAERIELNERLNGIFLKLLRNDYMAFNFQDMIYEAQKNRMYDLYESMEKGFLFKISLEDELKKLDFASRSGKIPADRLQASDLIKERVHVMKRGVDAAYEINLRMLNWALVVYAFIKMMMQES